jgi:hypothetical protein
MNADATAAALSNYDDETYRFCFFLGIQPIVRDLEVISPN